MLIYYIFYIYIYIERERERERESASFSHSFNAGLLATNSLSFPLSEYFLISSSFLKDIFNGYRILSWQFFFFSTWKRYYFLLTSMGSDEKSTVIRIVFFPLVGNASFFFSLFLRSFFLTSLVFRSLAMIYLCMDFFGFIQFGIVSAS